MLRRLFATFSLLSLLLCVVTLLYWLQTTTESETYEDVGIAGKRWDIEVSHGRIFLKDSQYRIDLKVYNRVLDQDMDKARDAEVWLTMHEWEDIAKNLIAGRRRLEVYCGNDPNCPATPIIQVEPGLQERLNIIRGFSSTSYELHIFPLSSIATFFAVFPFLYFSGRIVVRKYRSSYQLAMRNSHCCVQCGYDICATPDRCPECGTPAT